MTNMQPNFTVEEENKALISFLRADYDDALEQIRVLKGDVNELIDICASIPLRFRFTFRSRLNWTLHLNKDISTRAIYWPWY